MEDIMSSNISFKMWGERGLVATFFMDLCQTPDLQAISDFLEVAYNLKSPIKDTGALEQFTCVIEPDFGNRGFGRPDAILRFDCSSRSFVVILEAKLTGFAEACWLRSRRGEPTFNSKLNGQLELNYRLAMALARFKDGMNMLEESKWVPQSPYGDSRILKKDSVIKTLVPQFSDKNLRLEDYYYLVVTTDEKNPFGGAKEQYLPQLFKAEMYDDDLTFVDRWQELKSQFGWLNYTEMLRIIRNIEKQLPAGSLFLSTHALYEANKVSFQDDNDNCGDGGGSGPLKAQEDIVLQPPVTGKYIVLFRDEFCHLSCQRYGYRIRRLNSGRWIERERVVKGNEKRMLDMLSRVRVIEKDSTSIKDIPYWERRFNELEDR
jgi:hypothetical protein